MIFEFSWSWYEDYSPFIFEGPEKTEEEWKQDCIQALKDVGETVLKDDSWAGASGWVESACSALENKGYKRVKPVSFGVFGAYIIEGDDEDDKEFGELVGEELYQKAIEHNRLISEEMHKED